jgi:hypothetical protein
MNDILQFPLAFWISLAVLLGVACLGWLHRLQGWGVPAMAVCFTVIAWYHGDAIYNDYNQTYAKSFTPEVLNRAWLELAWFGLWLGGFSCFVPGLANRNLRGRISRVEVLRTNGRALNQLQPAITEAGYAVAAVWLLFFGFSLWRTNWDVLGLVAPYLGQNTTAWGRGQIASSWFDSIAALVSPVLLVCAAVFGVCAATLKTSSARVLMLVLMAISWPTYFFERTRHVMLLVMMPGLLAYAFFRLRGRAAVQISLLALAFISVNAWFKFVISERSNSTIAWAFASGALSDPSLAQAKHEGFNMFEELCWVNYLTENGQFTPKWGQLYLSNLANPIPRALWPNKPTMGLDYAIARGQQGDMESGVSATISSGLVGSGVVNFGTVFGPVAAAFLMTLWCTFLARLDLTGDDFGRLLIYLVGLISIFLYGRDITILIAYPTLFGFALLWIWRKAVPHKGKPLQSYAKPRIQRVYSC